ncbi:ethanolamine utilization protein [Escherichia coli]|uniref:Ethanolamine utilization protein n=1 Tax=Escherichia coli TaxID=562 RepID=A0AAX2K8C9_ECOLX|nr:ethanolamine utilization protein [Escherichia coli]
MPALDLIRPSVTAMRVIASVNAEFARELKLPPHIRSLGLISADSDDVTYIAADEATKQAMVEVVYGRSLYAGAAHGPSPTAGEVLIMLGGPNPAEVRAGLDAMVAHIENGAAFQWANDAEKHRLPGACGFRVPVLISHQPPGSRLAIRWRIWWHRRWKRPMALMQR